MVVAAWRDLVDGSVLLAELTNVMQLAIVLQNLGEVGDWVEARRLFKQVVTGETA